MTCVVFLSGISDNAKRKSSRTNWLRDIDAALSIIKERHPAHDIYGLGYSIGATLLVDAIDKQRIAPLKGLFFIAPAVSLTWRSLFLRPLLPLRHVGISLPSYSPAKYRYRKTTSLQAYQSSIALVDSVEDLKRVERLRAVPTEIILAPGDELVDTDGVIEWIEKHQLGQWRYSLVDPKPSKDGTPRHLMLDSHTLGKDAWRTLSSRLTRLLASTQTPHMDKRATRGLSEPPRNPVE